MYKKYISTPLVVFIRLSADDLIVTSGNDADWYSHHGGGESLDFEDELDLDAD